MEPSSERDPRVDELLDEFRRLARRVEGQTEYIRQATAPKPPDLWSRATQTVGAFLLAVSLTLGVHHEVHNSPATPIAQPVQSVQPAQAARESPLQRSVVEQLAADADRLGEAVGQLDEPGGAAALSESLASLSKDLKTIIKYPCAESVEDEAVEVLLELQLHAIQKVAAGQPITSTEHRVKRMVTLLKNLCA